MFRIARITKLITPIIFPKFQISVRTLMQHSLQSAKINSLTSIPSRLFHNSSVCYGKLKTRKGAAKRFWLTGNGNLLY